MKTFKIEIIVDHKNNNKLIPLRIIKQNIYIINSLN